MRDKLVAALLQGPHGVKGECKLRSLSGEWDHLFRLKDKAVTLVRDGRTESRIIDGIRFLEPNVLVKFRGIDSPEEVRKLTGMELVLDRDQAAPLTAGEFYESDLRDCKVLCQGVVVGTVRSVWDSGAHTQIEIRMEDGRSAHVPFLDRYVGNVDVNAGTIEIVTPWILE